LNPIEAINGRLNAKGSMWRWGDMEGDRHGSRIAVWSPSVVHRSLLRDAGANGRAVSGFYVWLALALCRHFLPHIACEVWFRPATRACALSDYGLDTAAIDTYCAFSHMHSIACGLQRWSWMS